VSKHLIFATSALDALAQCQELGIEFEDAVWVMNVNLLGDLDVSKHVKHSTPLFRQMPAYSDVKRRFPELPDAPPDHPLPPPSPGGRP
jgi:hypothetical protein